MKKFAALFSVLMILVMVAAIMPTGSAFAKDPGTSVLVVHNNTGASVTMVLSGVSGMTTLDKGITFITMSAGWHTYYTNTPCKIYTGTLNMNVSRELVLTCKPQTIGDIASWSRR